MPAKSEAQRRFIYGVKGAKFAKAHHFDNPGKLPARVGKKKPASKKKKPVAKKKATKHKGKKRRAKR